MPPFRWHLFLKRFDIARLEIAGLIKQRPPFADSRLPIAVS
jgi:hypothetical protein